MDVQSSSASHHTYTLSSARIIQASLYTLFAAALYYRTRSIATSLAGVAVTVVAGECLYRWTRPTPCQPEKLTVPVYPVATKEAEPADNRYGNVIAEPWNMLEVDGKAINASWMPRLLLYKEGCKKLADRVLDDPLSPEWEEKMGNVWRNWVQEKVPVDLPDYIATQGPLGSTCQQFWEMAWQHNIPHIICLTNLLEVKNHKLMNKCHPYWPQGDEPLTFGPFTIRRTQVVEEGDLRETTLEVVKGQEKRTLVHLHHTGWGDHGTITKEEMEVLLKRDQELYNGAEVKGPVIIHCSAGVGRTGTFLGAKVGQHNPTASPEDTLKALRACRGGMVQTEDQEALVKEFYQVQEAFHEIPLE